MTLHPILALDHVIEEYRDYLRTEFRAKDPALKEALERELDQPLFLAQEPFFQAHRPFRPGKRWDELPLDPRLARVMTERARRHGAARPEVAFLHQSDTIRNLLSPDPRPVVVTTGTGPGKTEAFLLPVIQNALEDAARYSRSGLTTILVYPMNALANDQFIRIQEYLQGAGVGGVVSVAQYDRGTSQAEREALRRNPPHILLTNYMMLEYLLVRPADRDGIFANHRCRYLVLDEIHTYRGTLGANIALLVRRLQAHLRRARQDWLPQVPETEHARRYPALVPVGTSATIKSLAVAGLSPEETRRQRDEDVQGFFARLTGADPATIRVFGEDVEEITIPAEAAYPPRPTDPGHFDPADPEGVRLALCRLAGVPANVTADPGRRPGRARPLARSLLHAAGIGSPLELKFLHLFEAHGFHPAKQVPIALTPGGRPITVADFAVPERRLAIYVDGAPVHVGTNLRRDRLIRQRLASASPPWRVVELRARDLGEGAGLVARFQDAAIG